MATPEFLKDYEDVKKVYLRQKQGREEDHPNLPFPTFGAWLQEKFDDYDAWAGTDNRISQLFNQWPDYQPHSGLKPLELTDALGAYAIATGDANHNDFDPSYVIRRASRNKEFARAVAKQVIQNPTKSVLNTRNMLGFALEKEEHDQLINKLLEDHVAVYKPKHSSEPLSLLGSYIYDAKQRNPEKWIFDPHLLHKILDGSIKGIPDSLTESYFQALDSNNRKVFEDTLFAKIGNEGAKKNRHAIKFVFRSPQGAHRLEDIAAQLNDRELEGVLPFGQSGLQHIPDSIFHRLAASPYIQNLASRNDIHYQIAIRGPLGKAAKFWYGYEQDVRPEHFAVGRSLHTNQPETITDHRQKTGTSEPHMDLLPHLREYAKKTQEGVIEKIRQGKLKGFERNGKWYVDVYRGVGGNLAQEIVDRVSIPTRKPEEMGLLFEDKFVRFPASHISSWTTNRNVAGNFAKRKISGHQRDIGVILKASMPVNHLLHSGFMDMFTDQQHAHPNESELVFHHPGDKPMHVVHPSNMEVIWASSGDPISTTVQPKKDIAKSSYEDIFKKKQVQEAPMTKSEAPPEPPPAPKEYSDWE